MSKSRAMKRTMRRKAVRRKTMRRKTMRRNNMRKTMRQKTMRKKTMRRNNMRKTMRRKNMRKKTIRRKYKRGGGFMDDIRNGHYVFKAWRFLASNKAFIMRGKSYGLKDFYSEITKELMRGEVALEKFLRDLVVKPEFVQILLQMYQDKFKKDSRLKGLFKGATGYISKKSKGLKEAFGRRSNTPASSSPLLDKEKRIPELQAAIDNLGVS